MPRSLGTYTPPTTSWYPAVNGVAATAADWNTTIADISAALTQSLSQDGQTSMTGNIPAGGFKFTNLGVGSASGDSVNYGQVFTNPSYTGNVTLTGNLSAGGTGTFTSNGSFGGTLTVTGLASLNGGATVTTATAGDNSTTAASTSFVQTAIASVNRTTTTVPSVNSTTSVAAVAGTHYVCTNVAAVTVTLPASPGSGDTIWVTFTNGLATNVIARNGNTIMGLAQDLTVDQTGGLTVELRFVNSDWRLV